MALPRVFADFHNADAQGRLRLNCNGTVRDLAAQGARLERGTRLELYGEELEVEGVVEHSAEEGIWFSVIDWQAIRTVADTQDDAHPFGDVALPGG
jgi:hypothetical protein